MAKKNKEQQYVMSEVNTPVLNYNVYVMSAQEKLLSFLGTFLGGGILGLVFYGGLFLDEDGFATTATTISNVVVFLLIGLLASRLFVPMIRTRMRDKRKNELVLQFRSFLDTLAVSLSSGMNMQEAMENAYKDLGMEYSESAYIVTEVGTILAGIRNNIPIERMLSSLGERSQIADIRNFATVFKICYRAGGNMKEIIRRTNTILSEKINISNEIDTALASNKSQFTAMMVIPVLIMIMMRTMSSDFAAGFASPAGVGAITLAIGMFILAYRMGQKIMDIKG